MPTSPLHGNPEAWSGLIQSIGPPSILVVIKNWMGPELRRHCTAEDIFQEALLQAWRDRGTCEWQGVAAFRRWFLQIAHNRIRDASDGIRAASRGGGKKTFRLEDPPDSRTASGFGYAGPIAETTPSQRASDSEQAAMMAQALESLTPELREVVRLRLYEDLPIAEVAARLGLGVEGVRHRFRKGIEIYRLRLKALRTGGATRERATPDQEESA